MRKVTIIALMIVMGLLLMACEEDGEFRIRNRTNALVKARVNNGDELSIDSWSGWSRFYSEDASVNVSFHGLYVYPDSTTRSIIKGLPTTINIIPDAGAILVNNDSTFVITEVYISDHDATEWGDNRIIDSLAVGANGIWTLDPGNWDLKVVSETGTPLYKMNQAVVINETRQLDISEFLPFSKQNKGNGTYRIARAPIYRK